MSMKISDILRADIRRLETALKNNDQFLKRVQGKAFMVEQALGCVMQIHHPDGVTINEAERQEVGKATLFRVSMNFEEGEVAGEGSMVLAPVPLTEEDRERIRKGSKKGPDIILPGA